MKKCTRFIAFRDEIKAIPAFLKSKKKKYEGGKEYWKARNTSVASILELVTFSTTQFF